VGRRWPEPRGRAATRHGRRREGHRSWRFGCYGPPNHNPKAQGERGEDGESVPGVFADQGVVNAVAHGGAMASPSKLATRASRSLKSFGKWTWREWRCWRAHHGEERGRRRLESTMRCTVSRGGSGGVLCG
jgi:hypothetical protein